jgi:hypothetical protein
LRKRLLLLPAALITIALLVPTIAYGARVGFNGTFPTDPDSTIGFHVKRVSGKNKKVLDLSFNAFDMDCTISDTEILRPSPFL